ncbi:MAG TPA: S41 family peptidase [Phycisphaerae bacterium]|nr:S41 family peptidase [Phycisphaerae bacterium]
MNKQLPPTSRFSMLLVPFVLAGGLWVQHELQAATPVNSNGGQEIVYDYADRVTRLVQSQKIEELSKLNIPATTNETSKMEQWKDAYVAQIQKQEGERKKEYDKAVSKAQEELKKEKFDEAMLSVVMAYQIAKDQGEFLKLDWVKDLTAKVADRAADFEKKGDWIESLQLYTDLSSLYEIDTRYKPDMQRLARRTRLLAVYTPQAFYETRKALVAKQEKEREEELKAEGTTQPAATTKPDDDEDLTPSFTRWQDYVEQIEPDMGLDAIRRARNDWVELTTYDALVKGGVDALRLFLTTPELAKEFPGLADAASRDTFSKALDAALAGNTSGKQLTGDDMARILNDLVSASDSSVKLPKEVIIMEFTDGAMEKLDPFSAVIWPHERPEFDKTMRGTFGGVGVMIGLESGKLQVISPLEDTPAYRAGIQAGDIITAIDGQSAINISIDQAVHKIMGKPDTQVTLRIKRGTEAPKEYTLTRAIINVHSVKGFERLDSDQSRWNYMLDPDSKIGYIRITGFQDETADELRAAIEELKSQGMRGLILDLRFNPGGLLRAAVDISDMFLNHGVIVSTRGRSAEAREYKWTAHDNPLVPADMPIVVLINQYSASASEIFSGAMKDLRRGYIIGHRSFGKGSVQNLFGIGSEQLADGTPVAEMKLTMAYYYLPNGENLHRRDGAKDWGVDPDVTVDLTPDQLADLLKQRRDSDVIHSATATEPATTQAASTDTQLDTALLMLRLQLVQSHPM